MTNALSWPASGPTSISFIIPVLNDADGLRRCLQSILTQRRSAGSTIECIVVDNGSDDESATIGRQLGATVVEMPHVTVAALRNRAAHVASGEVLAFVDADHELQSGWMDAAIDAFTDPDVCAAGAVYVAPPHGSWVQRMFGALRGESRGREDVTWLGSGNLAIRRAAFHRIGGFDEALATCEDVDLCSRLRTVGRLVSVEGMRSVHYGDPATIKALFTAERWRGRDNLRVSLRAPLADMREVASVVIPIIGAFSLASIPIAVLLMPRFSLQALGVLATALGLITALAALRTALMVSRGGLRSPLEVAQAYTVALAYDLGRASALLLPAKHRRGSARGPSAPAVAAR